MEEFALHRAASRQGNLKRVKDLIKLGASVDSRDADGRTPLHHVADGGQCAVAKLLIRHNCNVNLKDNAGRTPLLRATETNCKDIVHLLLRSGAQVDCTDNQKRSALYLASRYGWEDVVRLIIKISGKAKQNRVYNTRNKLTQSGGFDGGKVDVNAATDNGETPLIEAAFSGQDKVATLLVQAGADVNRWDAKKRTALHWASISGRSKVVKILLEVEGLDLNLPDFQGNTPLHYACSWGFAEIKKQLLATGAVTYIKNKKNETAFRVAFRKETLTVEEIGLFLQHGAYIEKKEYDKISDDWNQNQVLEDVDLCSQSIVNKFIHRDLPKMYKKAEFAKKLPCIKNFKLNPQQKQDIVNFVEFDIQTNTFCNVFKARPIVLSLLCVRSLLIHQYRQKICMKRNASLDFSCSNLRCKRHRRI